MTNSHTHICITYKHRGFVGNLQFSFDEEYMWPAVLEHYCFEHLNTEQGSDGLQVQVYSTDVHHLSVFLLTCRFCNQALRSKGLASSSCSRMCIIWFHEWQRRGEESISAIVPATAYTHMTEASYLAGCFIGWTKFKRIALLHCCSRSIATAMVVITSKGKYPPQFNVLTLLKLSQRFMNMYMFETHVGFNSIEQDRSEFSYQATRLTSCHLQFSWHHRASKGSVSSSLWSQHNQSTPLRDSRPAGRGLRYWWLWHHWSGTYLCCVRRSRNLQPLNKWSTFALNLCYFREKISYL